MRGGSPFLFFVRSDKSKLKFSKNTKTYYVVPSSSSSSSSTSYLGTPLRGFRLPPVSFAACFPCVCVCVHSLSQS